MMIIELRKKAQLTLPKEIVKQLNLLDGDKFEVSVENGFIKLEPVAVYSRQYIEKLNCEIQMLREELGEKYSAHSSVDELLESLEETD